MAASILEAISREMRYVEYKIKQHQAKRRRKKEKENSPHTNKEFQPERWDPHAPQRKEPRITLEITPQSLDEQIDAHHGHRKHRGSRRMHERRERDSRYSRTSTNTEPNTDPWGTPLDSAKQDSCDLTHFDPLSLTTVTSLSANQNSNVYKAISAEFSASQFGNKTPQFPSLPRLKSPPSKSFYRNDSDAFASTSHQPWLQTNNATGSVSGFSSFPAGTSGFSSVPVSNSGLSSVPVGTGGFSSIPVNTGGFSVPVNTGGFSSVPVNTGEVSVPVDTGGFSSVSVDANGFSSVPFGTGGFSSVPVNTGGFSVPVDTGGFFSDPFGTRRFSPIPIAPIALNSFAFGSGASTSENVDEEFDRIATKSNAVQAESTNQDKKLTNDFQNGRQSFLGSSSTLVDFDNLASRSMQSSRELFYPKTVPVSMNAMKVERKQPSPGSFPSTASNVSGFSSSSHINVAPPHQQNLFNNQQAQPPNNFLL